MTTKTYIPEVKRYETMRFNRTGKSGLKLPAISLGLWHNFGDENDVDSARDMCCAAFDLGITHFDLANNYGTPAGSAESNFGQILKTNFMPFRDEMIISSKAGYDMWPGPYGEWGSRKYLLASLDQSLSRLGLDYVDIYYSHRFDPDTPLEETMGALHTAVQQGKALYVGISSYPSKEAQKAASILKQLGTPCLIHQPRYSIFDRTIENENLFETLTNEGMGCIVFSPLAQGLLTGKYINGIPEGSRASQNRYLQSSSISESTISKILTLNELAKKRKQTLAQMAIAWTLREGRVTSAIIGASHPSQIIDCVGALDNLEFSHDELFEIDAISVGD